jgi:hypothetical protein
MKPLLSKGLLIAFLFIFLASCSSNKMALKPGHKPQWTHFDKEVVLGGGPSKPDSLKFPDSKKEVLHTAAATKNDGVKSAAVSHLDSAKLVSAQLQASTAINNRQLKKITNSLSETGKTSHGNTKVNKEKARRYYKALPRLSEDEGSGTGVLGGILIVIGVLMLLFVSLLIGLIVVLIGVVVLAAGGGRSSEAEKKEETPQYVDVVYLKNGSIIRGMLIEQIPDVSVKIQTKDGSIFVYKMEEVEKITKELQQQ